jgi:Flp pilus assembly protein TadD
MKAMSNSMPSDALQGDGGSAAAVRQGGPARLRLAIAVALLPVLLAACTGVTGQAADDLGVTSADVEKYVPSDEPYRLGSEHFARGEYGLAERYFRDAAELAPKDAASWIGLAASYDRLSRFDLADRCYKTAIALSGETALILNNQGYSYMLRGNPAAARAKFARARALEPGNPLVENNMRLLDSGGEVRKKGAS